MAVTIEQEPDTDLNLSGNPIVWVFSSDQTGSENFTYLVDVYVDSAFHSRHQVYPESGIYGKFDASPIAEVVCNAPTMATDENGADANNWVNIDLDVIEQYGATPTEEANQTTSTVFCIKAKKTFKTWFTWKDDASDYLAPNVAFSWLTDNSTSKLRDGEFLNLMFGSQTTGTAYDLKLEYISTDGSTQGIHTVSNSGFFITSLRLSWNFIETNCPGTFSETASVFVTAVQGGNISSAYTITLDRTCSFEQYRLLFLTQIGAIEPFTFDRIGRESMNVTASKFTTRRGQLNGDTFDFSLAQSGQGNFATESEKKITIESGWVSESVQRWLNDNLFTSPLIYLIDSDGNITRVANMSTSVDYKKQRNDMLFNVKIELPLFNHTSMIV